MTSTVKYGAIADSPDTRDILKKVDKSAPLPPGFTLEAYAGTPYDQKNVGACSGFSFSKMMEVVHNRKMINANPRTVPIRISPYFLYALGRQLAGWPVEDNGASIRDIFKSANTVGMVPDSTYSGRNDWRKLPSAYDKAMAGRHRISGYARVPTEEGLVAGICRILAHESLPVVVGVDVFPSIHSTYTRYSGVIAMPSAGEMPVGGHAVTLLGYDLAKAWFIGINSWGKEWGNAGFFYMPFGYASSFARDAWTLGANYY